MRRTRGRARVVRGRHEQHVVVPVLEQRAEEARADRHVLLGIAQVLARRIDAGALAEVLRRRRDHLREADRVRVALVERIEAALLADDADLHRDRDVVERGVARQELPVRLAGTRSASARGSRRPATALR